MLERIAEFRPHNGMTSARCKDRSQDSPSRTFHRVKKEPMMRLLTAWSVLTIFASLAVSQDAPRPSIQLPPSLVPALLLRKVAPVYPPLARAARIQGTIVLSILINQEGEIGDTRLVSGHPMLAPAAIEAVRQ